MFCRISEDHLNGPGSLAERLRALPSFTPPPGGWTSLQARLAARRRRFYAAAGSGFALAASVLVAVGLVALKPDRVPEPVSIPVQSLEVAQLITRSQMLERELARARPETVVWSSGREARAAALEQKVRVIDGELNYARGSDSAERLWRERVKAMNALVELHQPQEGPALQYASYQY